MTEHIFQIWSTPSYQRCSSLPKIHKTWLTLLTYGPCPRGGGRGGKGCKGCSSSHYHDILLWRLAPHLHLAPAAYTSLRYGGPLNKKQNQLTKETNLQNYFNTTQALCSLITNSTQIVFTYNKLYTDCAHLQQTTNQIKLSKLCSWHKKVSL